MWEGDVWVALKAARAAANIVAAGFFEPLDTELKSATDPVTRIDRAAEDAVRSVVLSHFPDDGFLGEESGGSYWRTGRVWITDPLDGTVNYVHRIPHVAVSIALFDNGEPQVGVIIDVARNDEYVAIAGQGATLNGKEIHVTATPRLEDSLVVTGFPYDRLDHAADYLKVVEAVMLRTRGTRRMGAAALDMAWVAAGRFDAYWEHSGKAGVKPWDVAAGMLLVTEAGGRFSSETGATDTLEARAFLASNGHTHGALRKIIVDTMPEHLK